MKDWQSILGEQEAHSVEENNWDAQKPAWDTGGKLGGGSR